METRGPDATHWNDATPMTARERRRRDAFLRHLRRQVQQQTGGQQKWNTAADDGSAEIVMLENVTEADGGV